MGIAWRSLLGYAQVDIKVINVRKPYTVFKVLWRLGIAWRSPLGHFEVDFKVVNVRGPYTGFKVL